MEEEEEEEKKKILYLYASRGRKESRPGRYFAAQPRLRHIQFTRRDNSVGKVSPRLGHGPLLSRTKPFLIIHEGLTAAVPLNDPTEIRPDVQRPNLNPLKY